MKLVELVESKLYKFYAVEPDGFEAFITNSTNLEATIPTMKKYAERIGKKIEVRLNGKKVGEITKNGFQAV